MIRLQQNYQSYRKNYKFLAFSPSAVEAMRYALKIDYYHKNIEFLESSKQEQKTKHPF